MGERDKGDKKKCVNKKYNSAVITEREKQMKQIHFGEKMSSKHSAERF